MKCDRKWYYDGRLEREYAEQAARDEAQRQLEMLAHPQPCPCMLCSPRYDLVAQLFAPRAARERCECLYCVGHLPRECPAKPFFCNACTKRIRAAIDRE